MSEPLTILGGKTAEAGLTVRIEERGPTGQIALKGDLGSAKVAKAVKAVTGTKVPGALKAEFSGDKAAVWLAPDELLLLTDYASVGAELAKAQKALAGEHAMVLDFSDARAVFRVTGKGAQELMAKGCPLDVSDKAFPVGTARRTHFAEIAAALWRKGDQEWEIVCFQSFAQHLFDWMVDASAEGSEAGFF